jgi:hypothetical protein
MFRLLWSSDHHTFHQTTPTGHVLNNLTVFLRKDHDLGKVDMVTFGGDFFERMVELPHTDTHVVFDWAKTFLAYAYKANPHITIVWLAGTSSHDWEQPRHFLNLAPEGMDVRYIDTLSIVTYEHLDGLTVMYVPDNMGALTPDEIWERAVQVLNEAGLEQVDQIHFHGAFEFQLLPKLRHKCHNLERWESITKYCILAGHIHTPVQKGKLYTSGSFDRTKHGEEHPKGGYCIDFDLKTEYFEANFWENKGALPYLTMNVDSEITADDLITDIHAFIKKRNLPRHSHIRVMGGSAMVVNPVISMLSKEYPQFTLKAQNEKNEDEILEEALFSTATYNGVSLTKASLPDSVFEAPSVKEELAKHNIDPAAARAILEEFL